MWPFAAEVNVSGNSLPAVEGVLQPRKHQVRVERSGADLILSERRGPAAFQIVFGGFLLLWLAGWTAGCSFLVMHLVQQPNLENVLFAIPFLVAWLFVLLLLGAVYCGRTWIRLGPAGLDSCWSIFGVRGRRRVPLDQVRGVGEYERVVDSESGQLRHGVKINTLGRSVRFAFGAESQERQWLIAVLEDHLSVLQSGLAHDPVAPAPVPCDSEFALERDGPALVFTRKPTGVLRAIASTTFLNLFWNGVVAVFVLELVKHFHWFLFLFLIPFEVLGAMMLLAWLAALTMPWRRRTWSFQPDAIIVRSSTLGIGWTWTFDPPNLCQVERRKAIHGRSWLQTRRSPEEEEDCAFALAVIDGTGRDLIVLNELTEGEARWIESELRTFIKGSISAPGAVSDSAASRHLWDRWLDAPA